MKFTYDRKENRGECVAFMHCNGELVFKSTRGDNAVCLADHYGGKVYVSEHDSFFDRMSGAARKFYPGDKITIEF